MCGFFGVLPVMIRGEMGVVGTIAIVIFLISFYITLCDLRLCVKAALFAVLPAINMGEAIPSSPSGAGGLLWASPSLGATALMLNLSSSARICFV